VTVNIDNLGSPSIEFLMGVKPLQKGTMPLKGVLRGAGEQYCDVHHYALQLFLAGELVNFLQMFETY
jgi:hypothetical protein